MKQEITWVPCKERLPEVGDSYLVFIKQKYDYQNEWEYHTDVAINYGTYIDDYWDTFIDWVEGQETHITHWAEIPYPEELIGSDDK